MFGLMRKRAERPLARLETPFHLLREEWLPLVERFFGAWPITPMEPWEWLRPSGLAMTEAEKGFVVRAELPGFEPAEVEVVLHGDVLTVEAKHGEEIPAAEAKEAEAKKGEPGPEYGYAHVRRSITLPAGVETEKIEAVYRNGVLEVRMPKAPEAVGRRIEVKT
jgi:HSP20 family protein